MRGYEVNNMLPKRKKIKKPNQRDLEEWTMQIFLGNAGEEVKNWNIQKYNKQDSSIDILAKNTIDNREIKAQIRQLNDELTGKFWSGKGFFGDIFSQEIILRIIKYAIKDKEEKYPPLHTKDIILLLNGWMSWDMLEMAGMYQNPDGKDVRKLLNEIRKEKMENFKEIYLVCKNFNLRIK